MRLSIIIPVYNEEKTVASILKKIIELKIPRVEKEIIVVNDGSKDGTLLKIKQILNRKKNTYLVDCRINGGKGAAVREGLKKAKGDHVVIQDADLEYDPRDIVRLLGPVLRGEAQVVYGTRLKRWPNFSRDERTILFILHYLGNKFLSLTTSLLYSRWITDMETCYKLFPRKAVEDMSLNAKGFEFEPEITAKLLKKGYRITEVPISTNPRDYKHGKKLNTCRDGVKALSAIIKYRFTD